MRMLNTVLKNISTFAYALILTLYLLTNYTKGHSD